MATAAARRKSAGSSVGTAGGGAGPGSGLSAVGSLFSNVAGPVAGPVARPVAGAPRSGLRRGSSISLPPRTDVAIIGGGLAGLTLACFLATHSPATDFLVFDLNNGPVSPLTRGIYLQARTLEILDALGVLDEVVAAAGNAVRGARIVLRGAGDAAAAGAAAGARAAFSSANAAGGAVGGDGGAGTASGAACGVFGDSCNESGGAASPLFFDVSRADSTDFRGSTGLCIDQARLERILEARLHRLGHEVVRLAAVWQVEADEDSAAAAAAGESPARRRALGSQSPGGGGAAAFLPVKSGFLSPVGGEDLAAPAGGAGEGAVGGAGAAGADEATDAEDAAPNSAAHYTFPSTILGGSGGAAAAAEAAIDKEYYFTLHVRPLAGAAGVALRARFCVGADGAASLFRETTIRARMLPADEPRELLVCDSAKMAWPANCPVASDRINVFCAEVGSCVAVATGRGGAEWRLLFCRPAQNAAAAAPEAHLGAAKAVGQDRRRVSPPATPPLAHHFGGTADEAEQAENFTGDFGEAEAAATPVSGTGEPGGGPSGATAPPLRGLSSESSFSAGGAAGEAAREAKGGASERHGGEHSNAAPGEEMFYEVKGGPVIAGAGAAGAGDDAGVEFGGFAGDASEASGFATGSAAGSAAGSYAGVPPLAEVREILASVVPGASLESLRAVRVIRVAPAAAECRAGYRAALIGDAACVHHILFASGTNAAVTDAFALGWRLALCVVAAPSSAWRRHLFREFEEETAAVGAAALADDAALVRALLEGPAGGVRRLFAHPLEKWLHKSAGVRAMLGRALVGASPADAGACAATGNGGVGNSVLSFLRGIKFGARGLGESATKGASGGAAAAAPAAPGPTRLSAGAFFPECRAVALAGLSHMSDNAPFLSRGYAVSVRKLLTVGDGEPGEGTGAGGGLVGGPGSVPGTDSSPCGALQFSLLLPVFLLPYGARARTMFGCERSDEAPRWSGAAVRALARLARTLGGTLRGLGVGRLRVVWCFVGAGAASEENLPRALVDFVKHYGAPDALVLDRAAELQDRLQLRLVPTFAKDAVEKAGCFLFCRPDGVLMHQGFAGDTAAAADVLHSIMRVFA